jgi:hypothetical protein
MKNGQNNAQQSNDIRLQCNGKAHKGKAVRPHPLRQKKKALQQMASVAADFFLLLFPPHL